MRKAAAVDVGVQITLKIVVAGHDVMLATLLLQAHPETAVLHEHVFDLHGERRANAREGIDHQANQRARLLRIEHWRLADLHHMPRPAHA